jgi:DNA-3-methyladenine glycosylase I
MYVGRKPETDSGYFENLTRCVFQGGMNWRVIDKKWSNFRKAFEGFDIGRIAGYGEADVEELMKDAGIVRNRRKILATIHNAREFKSINETSGSFKAWLSGLDKADNYARPKDELVKRLKNVGPGTASIFLHSVGEDIKHEDE